jgi:NitT/TauT family transport system substrate-binding protein
MNRATFTAALAAGAAFAPIAARAQSLATIRFGTTAVESYALAIYAQEAGFFKTQGLDAEITAFNGGGAVMTALVGGSLDYGCANWGAISNAHVKSIPVSVISAGGIYSTDSPTTILAGAKNSTYKTGKDLNGKTVAVSTLKDLQQASVMKWVDVTGGDSSTLKFLEIPIPEIPPALNSNRIDAGIVLEPILTATKNDIRIIGKCYDPIAKRLMICAQLGMTDYLNRNAAQTRKVTAALNAAALWANANHDKAGEILTRVAKIPLATISAMNRSVYSDKLELATIQPVIDASAEYKFLPQTYKAQDVFWSGLRG